MDSLVLEAGAECEPVLVARAQGGDVRAFERLYRLYAARIHGLCMRLVRNVAVAEDCTQQAFINAWTALPGFQSRSSFATWLHRIAVNVALAQRTKDPFRGDSAVVEAACSCTLDTPVEVRDIETAIQALPAGARDVLILCGIYGFSHDEAARMLGIASGTCRAQLHRARELLRERINQDGP